MRNKRIIISDSEMEFINGCLLGDGCLAKTYWISSYFCYISSEYEHTKYVSDFLKRFASFKYKDGPALRYQFCQKYQKNRAKYRFNTCNNITFYELRQKWYPEGKKIVPRDIELTPTTCLLWYIGDGSLTIKSQYITLSTNSFPFEDIDFLINKLNELDFESYKTKNHDSYIIIIPRRKVGNFLNYIGPCPVGCYNYKWDYKGKLEYKKKILQFDLNNNLIAEWNSAREIYKELGYHYANISSCCLKKRKTAYCFKWSFAP